MLDIRKMQSADLLRVVEIERACFGERWTVNSFQNELNNVASSYFIARVPAAAPGERAPRRGEISPGEIVGYAGYWLILEEAHITTIGVDPRVQRRGYGEYLLLHLIDHADRQGCKWLTLEVRSSNVAAQKLYEKYGFTSLGRRRGYYQDNQEDALVMWTENIGHPEYRELLARLRHGVAKRGTTI